MNQLLQVTVKDDQQLVSARDLHEGLKIKRRFSAWVEQNFKDFIEGEDFTSVLTSTVVNNGAQRELQDYALSIGMAKELSMMSHTEQGKIYRQYLIQLERKWNDPQEIVKRGYAILQSENTQLKIANKEMQPKANYFDDLVERNLLTNFRDTAKELHVGQKMFINWLLEHKYVYRNNGRNKQLKHYAKYDHDLFEYRESVSEWTDKSFIQTLITPKGRATFKLLLEQ